MTMARPHRMSAGELRDEVARFLNEHADHDHTVNETARALGGRSSGAVSNALRALVARGEAIHTDSHPHRYQGPAGFQTDRGRLIRPNGQTYHPRALADLPDVAALRRLREACIPALLYGPPGTGKTSLVEAAFPDLITVAGDGDTTVADFVGEYTQTADGRYEFVYGPLVIALREGRCLFIDDVTVISPKVLSVVYPAMDGR